MRYPEHRPQWSRKVLNSVPKRLTRGLRGLEIGACGMPIPVGGVDMSYLDFDESRNNPHCFRGTELVVPHIIDDAQHMRMVPPESFDFVLGNHVLEHVPDFFAAIAAWVRSVRPGGLVLFALPDACDKGWGLRVTSVTSDE